MLFDSTLRRELARNFGGTLVVLMTIVLTILFIRTLGQAAVGRIDPPQRGLAEGADEEDGEDDRHEHDQRATEVACQLSTQSGIE